MSKLYPSSGTSPYTQPASKSIAPIIHQSGGVPSVMAGAGKRVHLYLKQTFTVNANTTENLYSAKADDNGLLADFELDNLRASKEPFLLMPVFWSISVNPASAIPLNSIYAVLEGKTTGDMPWGFSSPVGGITINLFSQQAPIPIFRYDDFEDIGYPFLSGLRFRGGCLIDNSSAAAVVVTLVNSMLFHIQRLTV